MLFFGYDKGYAKESAMNKVVISAGHICLDITPVFPGERVYADISSALVPGKLINVEGANVHVGGSVANTGLALKKLGCNVRLLGKVGNDHFGNIAKKIVASYGASGLITDEGGETSYSVVIALPGTDRIFLHDPGANDTFSADDIPEEALTDAVLFHFGYPTQMKSMYEDDGSRLSAMFKRMKEKGIATSLDLSAVDPDSASGRADWKSILAKTLPYVDFFVPSFEELCYMLDRDRYDALAGSGDDILAHTDMQNDVLPLAERSLDLGCAVVLIKCGTKGMLYRTSEESVISGTGSRLGLDADSWSNRSGIRPCYKAECVRSATGAGDTSIAAFLAGELAGKQPEECVKLASAQGACCVTAYDALSGLKTMEELEEMIRQ